MRLVSHRTPRVRTSFTEALAGGLAPDGGLWVPEPIACFRDVSRLLELPSSDRAVEILHRLLGDEWGRSEVETLVREALEIPMPLVQLRDRLFGLELFHGPSLGFADIGVRFLARALALRREREGMKLRTVLVATCGSTGAAVAEAFRGMRGIRTVILYPQGRLTPLREAQIASWGGSVLAHAVDGSYDDCLRLVQRAFEDAALVEKLGLVSADALNIGRVLAQTLIFFEASAQLQALGLREAPLFALPCGTCGLLFAGQWARAMGLPVKAFVMACAGPRAALDLLGARQGEARPLPPGLVPGLEVTDPPNWGRLQHLFRGDAGALRATLRWGALDERGIRRAMWELHGWGFPVEPHTATAFGVLEARRGLAEVGIVLATAHPATWADGFQRDMNVALALPPALLEVQRRPLRAQPMEARWEALREVLEG